MTETPTEQPVTQQAPVQQGIDTAQWQQFMQGMAAQNQALAAQLSNTQSVIADQNARAIEENLSKLPDKERADALQAQLSAIKNFGEQAQKEQLSQSVWQRRDAEAAARLLMLHGMNGQEGELYKGDWDVNWMPRFVASVEHAVKGRVSRNTQQNSNAQSNPANRANVGTGTSNSIPEIDEKASGYDTIRFALQKASKS